MPKEVKKDQELQLGGPKRGNHPLATLTDADEGQIDLKKAGLYIVDGQGRIQEHPFGKFIINPSSWTDSKSANWAAKDIPGQSSPVFQYVSSGARSVSFSALVTNDIGPTAKVESTNKPDKYVNKVAEIAAKFFGAAVPRVLDTPKNTPEVKLIDIGQRLDYYRSLVYPTYSISNNKLDRSPPLVALYFGSSLYTYQGLAPPLPARGSFGSRITENTVVWIVNSVRINITKSLPGLIPLEAMVDFQLTEYNVVSKSRSKIEPIYR